MCPTSGVATWVPAAIPLPEGQVALTLREVCGLTTEEIARAFLVTPGDARAAHLLVLDVMDATTDAISGQLAGYQTVDTDS
jgi:hypothetical protein